MESNKAPVARNLASFIERLASGRRMDKVSDPASTLKLHATPVDALNLAKIYSEAPDALRCRLDKVKGYIWDNRVYEDALSSAAPQQDLCRVSNFSFKDAEEMQVAGITERIELKDIKANALMFTVDEVHKGRRRPICWSDHLNDTFKDVPTPLLADVVDAALETNGNQIAVCFDLANSFAQVQLDPKVRPFHSFVVKDSTGTLHGYQFKRLPMGTTFSPEVMQAISVTIGELVAKSAGTGSPTVHIDNLRFLVKSQAHAEIVRSAWYKTCERLGVTTKKEDEINFPHTSGDFLGITYDYSTGMVCLAKKTRTKLEEALALTKKDSLTYRELFKIFGLCCFASRVLRVPTSCYFGFFKLVRRRASELVLDGAKWEQSTSIWPSVKGDAQKWIALLSKNEAVFHPAIPSGPPELILTTDASLRGWGAVLHVNGTGAIHQAQGMWQGVYESKDINTLEVTASAKDFKHSLRSSIPTPRLTSTFWSTTRLRRVCQRTCPRIRFQ